jgi:phage I-like protein
MPRAALRAQLIVAGPYGTVVRTPPSEFRIFAVGLNRSTKGDFVFDDEAAASVMRQYGDHGVDLSIDYDHAALQAGAVPAAGWCKLEVRNGELWATSVKWTPRGHAALEDGEWRYYSPLFEYDEETRRVRKLINVAITNTPALYGVNALVAASALAPPPLRGGPMYDESDDAKYLSSLTPEQIRIISLAHGVTDPRQIAACGRKADGVARDKAARDREAEVVEAARTALANQEWRRR